MKCKVIIPFVNMDPVNGFTPYTTGAEVDLPPDEAKRMAEAGVVQIIGGRVQETAEMPTVETAEAPKVRRGKKEQS